MEGVSVRSVLSFHRRTSGPFSMSGAMSGLVWTAQHQQVKTYHLQKTANRKRMRRTPKGRLSGEDHQNAVLTNSEVESMRDLREQGKTYEWLADKFEVSKSAVAKICQYRRR